MNDIAIKPRQIAIPKGAKNALLHSCCAPCSGAVIEAIQSSGLPLTVFFYNPNIYPREEYDIRKNEIARFAKKLGVPFIDADYDNDRWLNLVKGLENEPEGGKRCSECFNMRLMRSAVCAHENKFDLLATTLGISRRKNIEQVNSCGQIAVSQFENLRYWDYNWRKDGGSARAVEISKLEGFYRQNYCGCLYSMKQKGAQ
ncbi:MAG: epoxyqueuosine reductase QueH [Alphaproteobacteria bacterium]|nr:epoxyqueuosine reductase QueH [Alphaproteobacteria bacterium]